MGNGPEVVYSWFACSMIGAVHVPINAALHGDFLLHQLVTADPTVTVVDPALLGRLTPHVAALPNLRHIILRADPGAELDAERSAVNRHSLSTTSEIATGHATLRTRQKPRWDDLGAILFTSGTTGPSKGVSMTQNYLVEIARTFARNMQFEEGCTWYQPSPLFHINTSITVALAPAVVGATGCTDHRFSASRYWDRVRHYGATHISFLTFAVILSKQPERDDDADNPVRIASGTAIPAPLHTELERRFALRIVKSYGLSESCAAPIMSTAHEPAPPGYAGKPSPLFDVQLFDENDEDVPLGDVGEIVMRPRAPHLVFSGYYNNPGATAEVWRNGWLHTGDLGRATADGWIAFVDRRKDYIRRRGENISSTEVEAVLQQHRIVAEVAAHGLPSELGEDDLKVCLVLEPGADLKFDEFMNFCVERLPYFAVPRYVEIVESIPRNQTGRILKQELRDRGITRGTWDREAAGYVVPR
jgi:crotonobetaine/carnitine-CoA ligase